MNDPMNDTEAVTRLDSIIRAHQHKPGALLPILHQTQQAFGYISPQAVTEIAKALSLSQAEVHGAISFYDAFHKEPQGKHRIQVCCAESCQAKGSRALEQHAKAHLNVGFHQTTSDREITLEPVYCLGNCACSPSIRVNDDIYGRVTHSQFNALVKKLTHCAVELS
ncbi:MAG: formate dehydrogenase subunit gamma [Pseudomonadales bacterium]|nr:formate dehydrogenase subunit gamma [Pseudomonadales bacterium]